MTSYQAWQENIVKRVKVVEDTLKNYNTFDQMKKLADNQKVEISENSITIECTDLSDTFFPHLEYAGKYAVQPAYELGSLKHLEQYGVKFI